MKSPSNPVKGTPPTSHTKPATAGAFVWCNRAVSVFKFKHNKEEPHFIFWKQSRKLICQKLILIFNSSGKLAGNQRNRTLTVTKIILIKKISVKITLPRRNCCNATWNNPPIHFTTSRQYVIDLVNPYCWDTRGQSWELPLEFKGELTCFRKRSNCMFPQVSAGLMAHAGKCTDGITCFPQTPNID